MGFKITQLWAAPEVNPINGKARSIPVLNPVNMHGRVFTFSWIGFLLAFWSWYAFPPLLTVTIKSDLNLTNDQVANSNIVALLATLLIRWVSGPLCDKFGPRKVFAGLLMVGAIPTAVAGGVTNANGLIALRFFVGILGGTFVPCQVWSTGFFDKNVVGTSNSLIGGWGNAGGGITYFVMPAIFDSLVRDRGLTAHAAWRVSFIVPFILITTVAILMLLLCPDTPNGKWSERLNATDAHLQSEKGHIVPAAGGVLGGAHQHQHSPVADAKPEKAPSHDSETDDSDPQVGEAKTIDEYHHEVIRAPTVKDMVKVVISPQSLVLAFAYFNSFGAELAINSVLGSYYLKNFPTLGQTGSGKWAAMFGLLNVVSRPLGGLLADVIYRSTKGSLWAKKAWIHFVSIVAGIFLIIIGVLDPHDQSTMFGLVAGMAIFLEAGNGAVFALLPHVHPHANGVLSGLTGGVGNFGGIIFAIIFRYNGVNYHTVFWIIGVIDIGINLAASWIRPLPKDQIGGR